LTDTPQLHEAQDFQMLGCVSPELDAVAAKRQGWQGDVADRQVDERTDGSDFSFWDKRANGQVLGRAIPNMAGHAETPMAAQPVTPYDPFQGGM
jgi:hypothetical protein